MKNNGFLLKKAEYLEPNISDWSLESPVLHREMEHARQPIRSGVLLHLVSQCGVLKVKHEDYYCE